MQTEVRIGSDLTCEVIHMAMQLMGVESNVQEHGNNLLGIGSDSYTQLMDRSFLAVDDKLERLAVALKFICHVVVCLGSIYLADHVVEAFPADLLAVLYVQFILEQSPFLREHSPDLKLSDHQRIILKTESSLLSWRSEATGSLCRNVPQQRIIGHSSFITADHDGIDALLVEAHHTVSPEVWLYLYVRDINVLVQSISHQHIDTLGYDIAYIIDIHIGTPFIRQVDSDNDISPHITGQRSRIIIPEASINQDHTVNPDRRKDSRNGHCRTHGIVYLSMVPDLRLAGNQIGGNAEKRDRKVDEIHFILIADRQRTYKIAYVLSIDITGRKASDQISFQEIGATLIIRTDIKHFVLMHRIIAVFVRQLHPEVVLFIIERDREEILLLVLHVGI